MRRTRQYFAESPAMVSAAGTPLPPRRERPRPPPPAVVEAEQQWIFVEEELLQAPSIVDGMAPEEERTFRRKGVNFILQVGMMLKLPQTTLSTAAVFFNRYLMRNSLKPKPGYKPLHHYVSTNRDVRTTSNPDHSPASCRDRTVFGYESRRKLSQDERAGCSLRTSRAQRP